MQDGTNYSKSCVKVIPKNTSPPVPSRCLILNEPVIRPWLGQCDITRYSGTLLRDHVIPIVAYLLEPVHTGQSPPTRFFSGLYRTSPPLPCI